MTFWELVSVIFYGAYLILAIYASVNIIYRRLDPVKSLSWVIVIFALPYIGLFLYTFLGQNFRKLKIYNRKGIIDERYRKIRSNLQIKKLHSNSDFLPQILLPFKKLILLNLKGNKSLLGVNDSIDYYFTGKDALDAMYESILNATKHIHLQSYIIDDDILGNRFRRALIKKANEGVEVRLIFDDVGCWSLSEEFLLSMRESGVEILNFAPVRFLTPTSKVNYRNHRKILVVDGIIGFLGGVNIADRYYTGGDFFKWRDTHIKIQGESVLSLQASFLLDRYFIIRRQFRKHRKKYYPSINPNETESAISSNGIFAQIITSGPDSDWSSIMQCYFAAITNAKKRIFIVTPYFTPNESILDALKVSALSGVEVNIILPQRSDSRITYWCTMSYAEELLEAGVKIYLYKDGFNHSKVITIDGDISIIGSANLDNRSFEHNFEITSIIYSSDQTSILDRQIQADISSSIPLDSAKWSKRSVGKRINESLARLLSPLL